MAIGEWEVEKGTLTNCDGSLGRRSRLGTLASPKLAELTITMGKDSQGRSIQDFARLTDAYVRAPKRIFVSCGQKIRQLNALARRKSTYFNRAYKALAVTLIHQRVNKR